MKKYMCGVDLGGTKLSAGLFLSDGTLLDMKKIYNHKDKECEGISDNIVRLVSSLLRENGIRDQDLSGIGIGVAGHINSKKGIVITSSNFQTCFDDYPLRQKIAEYFNTRVVIDNDANAQAYGEFRFGASRNYSDVIFITISTGVGCGIIINKQLVRGLSGTAGEIGHTIIDPDSKIRCSCGNYGCLMSLSSGQFLPELYGRYMDDGMASLLGLTRDDLGRLDGIMLKEGIESGDRICRMILKDSADAVGTGLFNLFQILDPELFIIGGGLINVGHDYINLIEKKFMSLVNNMMYDKIEIRPSVLDSNAGLLGAAALTLEK